MELSIGIIGRTAYGTELCDGQTVKTRVLVEELQRRYPNAKTYLADTYNYKKRAPALLKDLLCCLKNSQVVFILLSRNGMRTLFPVVNFLNRFYRRPIFHDCIGGNLDDLVRRYKGIKKQVDRFQVNWVESEQLKQRLDRIGVKNAEYLPNFKRLTALTPDQISQDVPEQFRFCTFSRVNADKGIGRAAQAVLDINAEAGNQVAFLDVYGPIEEHYDVELNQYIQRSAGAVTYKGVADYSQSVGVLQDYYGLLFPTVFAGEGFPGTLLDAFHAGLPVIATDWHLNGEIVTHEKTGFLYDPAEEAGLKKWMQYAMEHPEQIHQMKLQCLKEAQRYSPEKVMEIIDEKICLWTKKS